MNLDAVAEKAGVSTSTVSRVLNNGWVGAETRERVLSVIAELDYQPSMTARSSPAGRVRILRSSR